MEFTKGHEDRLNRLDVLVRGNGELGMRADVKNNTESLKDIEAAVRKATFWIITTLLTTVITLLITLMNR